MQMLFYFFLRAFGFLISLLSFRALHAFGRLAGTGAYYFHRSFRKKALTNLAIAYGNQKSEQERVRIAKKSFQNLMITCLEFFRLKRNKGKLNEIVLLEGMNETEALLNKKQGLVFLSGHQANWEIPFLVATNRFPGIAIGRPIKNKRLYDWILSIRGMYGGKIVMPKNALRQGLKALKEGKFLGIVGDQAFPESSYSYPLFGTRAWTSSAAALLAYKANAPLVVCMIKRIDHRYILSNAPSIWPNLSNPLKDEVPRMMDQAMGFLEKSIQETPEQWMWVHDRWKQQGVNHVKRPFRFGFVLIVLPRDISSFSPILPLFRQIYPRSFLTFYAPQGTVIPKEEGIDVFYYTSFEDLFQRDFRFQIVLDFYDSKKLRKHFKKLGAFKALSLAQMEKLNPGLPLSETIKHALVKKECLKDVSI